MVYQAEAYAALGERIVGHCAVGTYAEGVGVVERMRQVARNSRFRRVIGLGIGLLVGIAAVLLVISLLVSTIRAEAVAERATATVYYGQLQGLDGTKVAEEKLRQDTVKVQTDRQQLNSTRALVSTFIPAVTALVAVATIAATLLKQTSDANHQRDQDRQQRQDVERTRSDQLDRDRQQRQTAEQARDDQLERDRQQRQAAEQARNDARFNTAVAALGAEEEGPKASAIVALETFLRPEYTEYHSQILKLITYNLKTDDSGDRVHQPIIMRLLVGAFERAARALVPDMSPENRKADLDLSHAALEDLNLPGVDLRWANLHQARLLKAQLGGADLRDTLMTHVKAADASLQGARFGDAKLQSADLRRCHLQGAKFPRADLRDAKFYQAEFDGQTDFSGATFDDAALRTIVKATNWRAATFYPAVRRQLEVLDPPTGP